MKQEQPTAALTKIFNEALHNYKFDFTIAELCQQTGFKHKQIVITCLYMIENKHFHLQKIQQGQRMVGYTLHPFTKTEAIAKKLTQSPTPLQGWLSIAANESERRITPALWPVPQSIQKGIAA